MVGFGPGSCRLSRIPSNLIGKCVVSMGMGFGTEVFPEASLLTQTVTVDADDRQLVYGARRMRLCASTVVVATSVPPYGCTFVQNGHGRIVNASVLDHPCGDKF